MTVKRLSLFLILVAAFLAACSGDTAQDIENVAEQVGEAAGQVADNAEEIAEQAEEMVEEVVEAANMDGIPDLGGAELVVAIENAYPPFSFIDGESGDAIGYDYDIFVEICSRMNCTPVFQETSWDAIVAIMGGDSDFAGFDIGADGITITEERAQHVDFTRPYIELSQQLLVRVGEDRFSNADELAATEGLVVGSQPGTTNYDLSVEIVGEDRIVAYDQFALAVAALIQGDVDAVTIDNVAGVGYVGQNPDKVMLIEEPLTAEALGFILPKDSDLTAGVSTVLDAMEADGTLDALFQKWFVTEDDEASAAESAAIPDLGGAELVVAIENAYPPFSFIDADSGDAIGYDYDIFVEICSRINCTPVFQETSWDAIVAIMGGDSDFAGFDIGADGITITEERAEHVDFTRPYIELSQQLLVRVGEDRFSNADELAATEGLLVGSQPGTTNYDLSVEIVGEDRIVAYDQFALAVAALIQGDVDAVTIDNVAGVGYVGQNPDKVMLIEEPLTAEALGFILPKDSDLTAGVSAVLDAMEADGTLDMLFQQWFVTEDEEASAESVAIPDLGGAELVVAIENAYPPFSFIDADSGDAIGYDYDIFVEICSRMNCTPVFQETSWDAIVAIMGGDGDFAGFDIGADGITITEERAEHVDFTRPYIELSQQLLVRVGEDRFSNADELAATEGLVVGSQPGTTNYDLSVEIVGEDRIVAYDQFALAVAALIQGDVDAVTIDNVAGIGYVGQNPDKVMLIEEPLTAEALGFILPKDSDLTAGVSAVLDAMEADGTLDMLFQKWFVTEDE